MPEIPEAEIFALLESYVEGKDRNRPGVIEGIYAPDAVVTFDIRTPRITFPPEIRGSACIARILSADFNRRFSSPRTYYLKGPRGGRGDNSVRGQPWLVIMQEASTGLINVGWGTYDWFFEPPHVESDPPWQIRRHHISIWEMVSPEDPDIRDPKDLQHPLSYPWPAEEEVRNHPGLQGPLREIVKVL